MIWMMIVGAGLATYATRVLFFLLPATWSLPPGLRRLLAWLPLAAFTALALPGLTQGSEAHPFLLVPGRLVAGLITAYLARRTRRVFLAVSAGLVVVWLYTWVS
jgi:branched-subunit amino acid transport protein